jgi:hypothetical protein
MQNRQPAVPLRWLAAGRFTFPCSREASSLLSVRCVYNPLRSPPHPRRAPRGRPRRSSTHPAGTSTPAVVAAAITGLGITGLSGR